MTSFKPMVPSVFPTTFPLLLFRIYTFIIHIIKQSQHSHIIIIRVSTTQKSDRTTWWLEIVKFETPSFLRGALWCYQFGHFCQFSSLAIFPTNFKNGINQSIMIYFDIWKKNNSIPVSFGGFYQFFDENILIIMTTYLFKLQKEMYLLLACKRSFLEANTEILGRKSWDWVLL